MSHSEKVSLLLMQELMEAEGLSRLSTDMLVRYVLVLITLPTQMHGSWLAG